VLIASGVTGNSLSQILQGNFTRSVSPTSANASTGATTPLSVETLFTQMDALVGTPYKWGGGHSGYGTVTSLDCSGAVSYVLHAAGFLNGGPQDSSQLMSWGTSGVGSYFTVFANPVHVFIRSEFGNRKGMVWSADHPGAGGQVAWRPGNTFPTSAYSARHYPGA
jgi:hypothetical protein